MSPRAARTTLRSGLILTGILAGILLGTRRVRDDMLRDLARETRDQGVPDLRLSVVSSLRPCASGDAECAKAPARPSRRALAVIRRATEAARAGIDPHALHAAGVATLIYSGDSGNLIDQSISYLQSASRLTHRPAPVLADLAAAHLRRARVTGSRRDLFQALEAAEWALELEPGNVSARYNAAAALQWIGTTEQAVLGWRRYLEVDSTSGWAREARRGASVRVPQPLRLPGRAAPAATVRAFAAREPRAARELGWDHLLREWGAAVLTGDSATARARLRQAEWIGAELTGRGGDASLADAVAEIRGMAGRDRLRSRANAQVNLGRGRNEMYATRYEDACPALERALDGAKSGPVREWAEAFLGFCSRFGGDGRMDLDRLAATSDTVRYPAAAGRRWMALAGAHYNAGRFHDALPAYERAAALFERAGERENAATARMNVGDVQCQLGQADAGYALLHQSLGVLRDYPGLLGLWNGLYALRNALLADGLSRAALRVQDEAVSVSRLLPPSLQAETYLARARLHLAVERRDIDADVHMAAAIMETADKRYMKDWLRADFRLTRAEAWLPSSPDRAAGELDSVVDYFSGNVPRQLSALFSRAQARLALGRRDSAGSDLRRAAALLDSRRADVASAFVRASLLEQSRRIFDQAVMLSLRSGRSREALDYVEQSRASFSSIGRAPDWGRRPLRAPRGEVAVEFALVGDTLLAWTVWDGGLQLTRQAISRAELVRTAERVRSAMELWAPDSVAIPVLGSLFDVLVRPLMTRLGPTGTPLTIVADGELAGLPMAALYDRQRRRYLVEDHPLRFASSLRDPFGGVRSEHGLPLTLVADPAFDPRAFPQLESLPGAAAEVRAIRQRHRGARVIEGAGADASAIRAALEQGGVVHFAGHAVFDDTRPERSFLVTAARSGGDAPDRLTAGEIERMQLGRLRLVVLSACQTSRAQAGRSGGFAGLAGAFLAAGAGGVVGSLWRVDDTSTRELMDRFHGAYARSGDAAHALRDAQLQLLKGNDSELRSPAAWAGFRYMGG